MKQTFFAALASVMIANTPALAQDEVSSEFFYDFASPEAVETVEVFIADSARDGCWTNLGEAKTYAEDQLRLKGYEITESMELGEWRLRISVSSRRTDGPCWGSLKVDLYSYARAYGTMGLLKIGQVGSEFVNNQNANIIVLDHIKKATDAFPKR